MKQLLKEAAAWRLLSMLFECPSDSWRQRLQKLAREVDDATLREAVQIALEESSEGHYHSVFGPGGPAPAREVSYHDAMQLGYLMSDITARYSAFAFEPGESEPQDHLAIELRFVSYLRFKQAYAEACGDAEKALIAAEAADAFVKDHLRSMAEPVCASLEQSGCEYLRLAGQALLNRVGKRDYVPFPVLQEDVESDVCAL